MEPPYITFKSPYGGFGLNTRTSEAACRRIDGLLATCGVDVEQSEVSLSVAEPCAVALALAIHGPFDHASSGFRTGDWPLARPADELARAHDHTIGEIAREAWATFGAPRNAGADARRGRPTGSVIWAWVIEKDVARATAAYPTFCAFMHRHQAQMENDYSSAVVVRGYWQFRLHSESRGVAGPPYPASSIRASLAGRHASAFFDLVFPYDAPTPEFLADYAAVCAALGMKLPPSALRLCSPTRAGGRKWTKVKIVAAAGGLQSP
jgi:hypothetical protein